MQLQIPEEAVSSLPGAWGAIAPKDSAGLHLSSIDCGLPNSSNFHLFPAPKFPAPNNSIAFSNIMADPLTIVGTIIAVITAGSKLTELAHSRYENFSSATKDYRDLCTDLKDLCGVLDSLKDQINEICYHAADGEEQFPSVLLTTVDPALATCTQTLELVEQYLYERRRVLSSPFGKFRWMNGSKNLCFLRASLADRKLTLNMALAVALWSVYFISTPKTTRDVQILTSLDVAASISSQRIARTTYAVHDVVGLLADAAGETVELVSNHGHAGSDISSVVLRRFLMGYSPGSDVSALNFETAEQKRHQKSADSHYQVSSCSVSSSLPTTLEKCRQKIGPFPNHDNTGDI